MGSPNGVSTNGFDECLASRCELRFGMDSDIQHLSSRGAQPLWNIVCARWFRKAEFLNYATIPSLATTVHFSALAFSWRPQIPKIIKLML